MDTAESNINGKAASSHTHTKSQITDFPSSLPASDVYSWAKQSSKPSYAWSEITSKPTMIVQFVALYEQSITLAGGQNWTQAIPSQYQKDNYYFSINCTATESVYYFICNMNKFNMCVRNTSSSTLTCTVQVLVFTGV